MNKKLLSLTLAAAVGAAGMLIWTGTPHQALGEDTAIAVSASVRPVPTAVVRPVPSSSIREFPATVQAARSVAMTFSVAGELIELKGKAGLVVKKGDVLARLDPRDYKNALDAAQAGYDVAKQNLKRMRTLIEQNVTTQSELDSAVAAFDTAEAELRIRRKALQDTVMRAHFDGVVAKRYVENHEHVKTDTPILSLQSRGGVEVVFQVPERLLARWGKEALSSVQVLFEGQGQEWHGARVREVSTAADAVTRTYQVRVALDAPEGILLLSGMTAKARIALPTGVDDQGAVVAPMAAVFGGSDGASYVWVLGDKEGHPRKVRVELGGMRDNGVVVVSGLESGDRVAVAGVHTMNADMVVRPLREGVKGLE